MTSVVQPVEGIGEIRAIAKLLIAHLNDAPDRWMMVLADAARRLQLANPSIDIKTILGIADYNTAVLALGFDPNNSKEGNRLAFKLITSPQRTLAQRAQSANIVSGWIRRLENTASDVTHASAMLEIKRTATSKHMSLVWVAERNACPKCLDLSGSVTEPGNPHIGVGLVSSNSATRPPAHPNCRCTVELVRPDDPDGYASGLRREAARSAADGLSDYASKTALRTLASRVIEVAPYLPKSVLKRADKAASTGVFKPRPEPIRR